MLTGSISLAALSQGIEGPTGLEGIQNGPLGSVNGAESESARMESDPADESVGVDGSWGGKGSKICIGTGWSCADGGRSDEGCMSSFAFDQGGGYGASWSCG